MYDPLNHIKLNDVDAIDLKPEIEVIFITDEDYKPLPGNDCQRYSSTLVLTAQAYRQSQQTGQNTG